LILTGFASAARGADTRQLLENIEKASGRANAGSAIESGVYGLSKSPDFATLTKQAKANWRSDLDHFSEVAPSNYRKTVLFVSYQTLPKKDYIKMANKAVDLANQGEVDPMILKWILRPVDKNVHDLLGEGAKSPEVVEFWLKAKLAFANDESMRSYIDDTLNRIDAANKRRLWIRIGASLFAGVVVTLLFFKKALRSKRLQTATVSRVGGDPAP